ncbi:hypothetical protein QFZ79_003735 [Arthrobacter sp. V4I6]|nr:hypothetical protein [Arthrobacter sp. V1I7]MDQ0855624.1 hypothetical protein [Arthrobacter sp. V4I6]
MTEPFLPQMISWVEQSQGKIRCDIVHEKLLALGLSSPRFCGDVLAGIESSSGAGWPASELLIFDWRDNRYY